MLRRSYLYYLADPRTDEVRYVGWTVDTMRRLKTHQKPKAKDKSYRANWVRSLIRDGVAPRLVVKVVLQDEAEAKAAEVRAISVLRARGYRLVNGTVGGDGLSSASWTPELRNRVGASHADIPAWNKGRAWSPEERKVLSVAHRGKPMLPQTRQALLAANTGRVVSAATREKLALAKVGFRHTEEGRRKSGFGRRNPWNKGLTGYTVQRNEYRCGKCQEIGHNVRTCGQGDSACPR